LNNKILVQLIVFFLFICFFASASADEVNLKDGKTLKGEIIREDNETISLETTFLNGKLVRKIPKSEIIVSEVNELKPQNTSDAQKLYFDNNIVIGIPKEWKFYKNSEFAKLYWIEANDNPYGKFRLLVTIDTYSLPQSVKLEQFFGIEILGMEKSMQRIKEKGYVVVNGINMQCIKYYIEAGIVYRYSTLKDHRAYRFDFAAGPEGPKSLPDTYDEIVKKIKF
jgi:hypothetical protein